MSIHRLPNGHEGSDAAGCDLGQATDDHFLPIGDHRSDDLAVGCSFSNRRTLLLVGAGLRMPARAKGSDPPVAVGMSAAPRAVRLFGTFAPTVAKAVLNYEDGTSDTRSDRGIRVDRDQPRALSARPSPSQDRRIRRTRTRGWMVTPQPGPCRSLSVSQAEGLRLWGQAVSLTDNMKQHGTSGLAGFVS